MITDYQARRRSHRLAAKYGYRVGVWSALKSAEVQPEGNRAEHSSGRGTRVALCRGPITGRRGRGFDVDAGTFRNQLLERDVVMRRPSQCSSSR